MNPRIIFVTLTVAGLLICGACTRFSAVSRSDSGVLPPSEIVDFNLLYGQNCAGCHGSDGKGGAAIALANPVFLAIADDTVIRRTTSNGVPETPMPAFAQSAGGMLADKQIDALVRGIRAWAKPEILAGVTPPPYAAQSLGNPQRGADVYRTYCSSCHGVGSRGGNKASSIVDGSYLVLTSDQQLRTIVIAGRPELAAPDWRGDVEGRPMSAQDVSDVVAWLSKQRPGPPGQPSPTASMDPANGGSR